MRKVILGLAVSLDGLIEGPNGEYDWCFTDQDYGLKDFFKSIDTIFMGRKSYEVAQKEGADYFNNISKYIFSNTLTSVPDGMQLVSGNLAEEVKRIKELEGKNIWLFGGSSLTNSFIEHNLIDEYWLSIHPIILGKGKPLFIQNDRKTLKLIDHKVYSSGLVSVRYVPI